MSRVKLIMGGLFLKPKDEPLLIQIKMTTQLVSCNLKLTSIKVR